MGGEGRETEVRVCVKGDRGEGVCGESQGWGVRGGRRR